jgi:hypothetical protein
MTGQPQGRVRSPDRIALDRKPNRLEHQEIRPHRTPLPHRDDPSRTRLPVVTPKPGPGPRHRDAATAGAWADGLKSDTVI